MEMLNSLFYSVCSLDLWQLALASSYQTLLVFSLGQTCRCKPFYVSTRKEKKTRGKTVNDEDAMALNAM